MCLTSAGAVSTTALDCDIRAEDHASLCINYAGGQCYCNADDVETVCGAIQECAGVFCPEWETTCAVRSAREMAYTYTAQHKPGYKKMKPSVQSATPTSVPSASPTEIPTSSPSTRSPTLSPTLSPTVSPTNSPTFGSYEYLAVTGGCAEHGSGWLTSAKPYSQDQCASACKADGNYEFFTIASYDKNCKCHYSCTSANDGHTAYKFGSPTTAVPTSAPESYEYLAATGGCGGEENWLNSAKPYSQDQCASACKANGNYEFFTIASGSGCGSSSGSGCDKNCKCHYSCTSANQGYTAYKFGSPTTAVPTSAPTSAPTTEPTTVPTTEPTTLSPTTRPTTRAPTVKVTVAVSAMALSLSTASALQLSEALASVGINSSALLSVEVVASSGNDIAINVDLRFPGAVAAPVIDSAFKFDLQAALAIVTGARPDQIFLGPIVVSPMVNEVQQVTIAATGGFFTLAFLGQTTAALAFDASAMDFKLGLEGLSTVPSDSIDVIRNVNDTNGVIRTFTMYVLDSGDIDQLVLDASTLTGPSGSFVATVTEGAGRRRLSNGYNGYAASVEVSVTTHLYNGDDCRAGFTCGAVGTTMKPCVNPATYCPLGSFSEQVIPEGYVRESAFNITLAPVGHYAASGTAYPCAAGRYASDTGNHECQLPPSGYVRQSASNIMPVPVGHYAVDGNAYACAPGRYAPSAGALECQPCPVGFYEDRHNSSACLACPVGHFCPSQQMIFPAACVPGRAGPQQSLVACVECSQGTFSNASGIVSCHACPKGSMCPAAGMQQARPCPAGQHGPIVGMPACVNCPPGSYASTAGHLRCVICPEGDACPEGTITPTQCDPTGYNSDGTEINTPQGAASCNIRADRTESPTAAPTAVPSANPTTGMPTRGPTSAPTAAPSASPTTSVPSASPTSSMPTTAPSTSPTTSSPTVAPTAVPSASPTTATPTVAPSVKPTSAPTASPTLAPTLTPTLAGASEYPTSAPTAPTFAPTANPTKAPTTSPTAAPSTSVPTAAPTAAPSTSAPTASPTSAPSTSVPTAAPTAAPSTSVPTESPTTVPTNAPTSAPTSAPTCNACDCSHYRGPCVSAVVGCGVERLYLTHNINEPDGAGHRTEDASRSVVVGSTSDCLVEGGQVLTATGARLTEVTSVKLVFIERADSGSDWETHQSNGADYSIDVTSTMSIVDAGSFTFTTPCVTDEAAWRASCASSPSVIETNSTHAGLVKGLPLCGFRVVVSSSTRANNLAQAVFGESKSNLVVPLIALRNEYSYDSLGFAYSSPGSTAGTCVSGSFVLAERRACPLYACYLKPVVTSITPFDVQPGGMVTIVGSNFGERRPDCGNSVPYFAIDVGAVRCIKGTCVNEMLSWSSTEVTFRISTSTASGVHEVKIAVGGPAGDAAYYAAVSQRVTVQNANTVPQSVAFVESGSTTQATISWDKPKGGAPDSYSVQWSATADDALFESASYVIVPGSSSSVQIGALTSAVAGGLEPHLALVFGTVYRVRVQANFSSSTGDYGTATPIFVQHSVAPSQPMWPTESTDGAIPVVFISYTNQDVRAVASFIVPEWNGGTPMEFTLKWEDLLRGTVGQKTVAVSAQNPGAIQAELITGLKPGYFYNFTVTATTKAMRGASTMWYTTGYEALRRREQETWNEAIVHTSAASLISPWHVTVPIAPLWDRIDYLDTAGSETAAVVNREYDVTLKWTAPAIDGNAPILDYRVEWLTFNALWTPSITISNFTNTSAAIPTVATRTIVEWHPYTENHVGLSSEPELTSDWYQSIRASYALEPEVNWTMVGSPGTTVERKDAKYGLPLCFQIAAENGIGLGPPTPLRCTCGAGYYLQAGTGTALTPPICKPCAANCDFCSQASKGQQCVQCSLSYAVHATTRACVAKAPGASACGLGNLYMLVSESDPLQGYKCVPAGEANDNCTKGEYVKSVSECGSCLAGSYSDLEGRVSELDCKPCALGTFSPVNRTTAPCGDCPAGKYTTILGASTCESCTPGKYNPNPGLAEAICLNCPAGKYVSTFGAMSCVDCSRGFVSKTPGWSACEGCEIGTLASFTGESSCKACEEGTYSINKASTCWKCDKDAYANREGDPGFDCTSAGKLSIATGLWFDEGELHSKKHIDGTETKFICPGTLEDGCKVCDYATDSNGTQTQTCNTYEPSELYECMEETTPGEQDSTCQALVFDSEEVTNFKNTIVSGTNITERVLRTSLQLSAMNCTDDSVGVLCALCPPGHQRGDFGCQVCVQAPKLMGVLTGGQVLIAFALMGAFAIIFCLAFFCMRKSNTEPQLYKTVHTIIVLKWFIRSKLIPRARSLVEAKRRRENGEKPLVEATKNHDFDPSHVKVRVISARHLVSTDADNKSDPFVKVFWRAQSAHSWVDMGKITRVRANTLNPEWNQTFTFRTRAGLEPEIKLEVWDDDGFGGGDDPIGHVTYKLDGHGPSTGWANIVGGQGQLQANVGCFPFTDPPHLPCFETKQATCYVTSGTNMPRGGTFVKLLTRPDASCKWTDTATRSRPATLVDAESTWNEKFDFTAVVGAHTAVRLALCSATDGTIIGRVDLGLHEQPTIGFHTVLGVSSDIISRFKLDPTNLPSLRASAGFGLFSAPTLAEDRAETDARDASDALAASAGAGRAVGPASTRTKRWQRAAGSVALLAGTTAALSSRPGASPLRNVAVDDHFVGHQLQHIISRNFEGRVAEQGGVADEGDLEGAGAVNAVFGDSAGILGEINTTDANDAMRGDVGVASGIVDGMAGGLGDIAESGQGIIESLGPMLQVGLVQVKELLVVAKAVYDPIMSQWKVLLANLQILGSLQVVMADVPWPKEYLSMLDGLSVLKFDVFMPIKFAAPCVDLTFYDGVIAFLLIPIVAVAAMLSAIVFLGFYNVFMIFCCKPCQTRRGCRQKRERCAMRACCVDEAHLNLLSHTGETKRSALSKANKDAFRKATKKMLMAGKLFPMCCKKEIDWSDLPPLSCHRGEVWLCPIKYEYLFVFEKLFITITLLLYPGLCNKCFLLLQCDTISGVSYLTSDYSQVCQEGEHMTMLILALCGIAFYITGIPLLILLRLGMFRCCSGAKDAEGNRLSLLQKPSTATFLKDPYSDVIDPAEIIIAKNNIIKQQSIAMRYGSLYDAYEDEYWYFELIAIVRKLFLTGVIVLLNAYSQLLQLLAAILVCTIYLVCVTSFQPYIDARDDRLAVAEALQMLLTMIIALALSMDDGEDPATTQILGYVLIGLTIAVICLAIYQLPLGDLASHIWERCCTCCTCCGGEEDDEGTAKKNACWGRSSKVEPELVKGDNAPSDFVEFPPTSGDVVRVDGAITEVSAAYVAEEVYVVDEAAAMMDTLAEAEAFLLEASPADAYDEGPGASTAEKLDSGQGGELDTFDMEALPGGKESKERSKSSRAGLADGLRRSKAANMTTEESVRLTQMEFHAARDAQQETLGAEKRAKEQATRKRLAQRRVKQMAALRKRFAEVDSDGSGSVGVTELHVLLPEDIDDADVEELIERFDADGSGEIDVAEFEALMKVRACPQPSRSLDCLFVFCGHRRAHLPPLFSDSSRSPLFTAPLPSSLLQHVNKKLRLKHARGASFRG